MIKNRILMALCVVVPLTLLGCASVEERQKRAELRVSKMTDFSLCEIYYFGSHGTYEYEAMSYEVKSRRIDCQRFKEDVFEKRAMEPEKGLMKGLERAAEITSRGRQQTPRTVIVR